MQRNGDVSAARPAVPSLPVKDKIYFKFLNSVLAFAPLVVGTLRETGAASVEGMRHIKGRKAKYISRNCEAIVLQSAQTWAQELDQGVPPKIIVLVSLQ